MTLVERGQPKQKTADLVRSIAANTKLSRERRFRLIVAALLQTGEHSRVGARRVADDLLLGR